MASLEDLIKRTSAKQIRSKVTQRVLQTIHTMTEKRIFQQGIDANSQLIGVYSPEYRKERARKNYPISTKVILQATSQMVNDYKFLVLPQNKYGSGFSNMINFKKSEWVEDTYNKKIFALTNNENKEIEKLLDKQLDKILKI